MKDVILELCGFRPDQEAKAAYASAFAAYSLYGWVEVWFRRGCGRARRSWRAVRRRGAPVIPPGTATAQIPLHFLPFVIGFPCEKP